MTPKPAFGDPLPPAASPETLAFLARRRSASALTLGEPAPSPAELDRILALAARAPDHGKLAPWRFIVLAGEGKAAFVAAVERIAEARADAARALAKLGKLRTPPLTVVVVSRHVPGEIPEWEQRLSAGAACMLMVTAAGALGSGPTGSPIGALMTKTSHACSALAKARRSPALSIWARPPKRLSNACARTSRR